MAGEKAAPEGDSLRFDKAEPAGGETVAGMTCAGCSASLSAEYWRAAGRMLCRSCGETARAQAAAPAPGSRLGRLARALGFGLVGAAIGAGIYFAILKLTGYEVGIIAILVGILVGNGVRVGSRGVGGRGYQLLAALLTYLAIVSTYIPMIWEGARSGSASDGAAAAPSLALAVVVVAIAIAAPWLAGFENIMGWIIIAIGLWQAWKVNARTRLVVEGPFRIEPAAVSPAPGAAGA